MIRKVRKDKGVKTVASRDDLTQELLKQLLHYDPDTGLFTWLKPIKRVKPGSTAGSLRKDGYVVIKISSLAFKAHRLASLYMTGKWPVSGDHRDGDPSNNKWLNLRPTTHAQNCLNRVMRVGETAASGVTTEKRGKVPRYRARISANGIRHYLGQFSSLEEAKAVVDKARATMHGEFSVKERAAC